MQKFQNNISFNIENIKTKTGPWQRKIHWSFYGNIYVWVWCSLNLFACSRILIPVLKEPVLLLLSRMTRTTTPFVQKVTSPNINKVLLTLSFQKFLQQSLKLWPSLLNMCWNMLVICTSFYLALLSKNMYCVRIFTEDLAYFDIFLC